MPGAGTAGGGLGGSGTEETKVESVDAAASAETASPSPSPKHTSHMKNSSVILKNTILSASSSSSVSSLSREGGSSCSLASSQLSSISCAEPEPEPEPQPLAFNIYSTVLGLRKCRPGMVQNCDQYMFCYKAIIDEARSNGLLPQTDEDDEDERTGSLSSVLTFDTGLTRRANPLTMSSIGWGDLSGSTQKDFPSEHLIDSPSVHRRRPNYGGGNNGGGNPPLSGIPLRGNPTLLSSVNPDSRIRDSSSSLSLEKDSFRAPSRHFVQASTTRRVGTIDPEDLQAKTEVVTHDEHKEEKRDSLGSVTFSPVVSLDDSDCF